MGEGSAVPGGRSGASRTAGSSSASSSGARVSAPKGRTKAAVRWNTFSLGVRQLAQILGALVIARILGPADYGVVSAAMILVVLAPLLLDLGLSSAVIQRPGLTDAHVRTTTTVNLVSALVMGGLVVVGSGWIAEFFGSPPLRHIYTVLGLTMVLKGLAVTPRALVVRELRFKPLALSESAAAVLGVGAGIVAAVAGARYDAVLWQVVLTDLVTVAGLRLAVRAGLPGWSTAAFRDLVGFGGRIFAANSLAYLSRNADNILVGRFLGLDALAVYAMAYRVLVIPVQFIGQTVNRVMFPRFSRAQQDMGEIRGLLNASTRLLSFITVPVMTLAAVAAADGVYLVLGQRWMAAAPLISVLAIAGARETIFYITPALMRGLGHAALNLRIEVLATAVQVAGICIGLTMGALGVAVGYLVAGMVLVPVMVAVQRRLTGVRVRDQLLCMLPAVHASAWGAAGYVAVRVFTNWGHGALLALGTVVFIAVWWLISCAVHPAATRSSVRDLASVAGLTLPRRRRGRRVAVSRGVR